MKKKLTMLLASLFLVLGTAWAQAPVATPTEAITGLLNRIGGNGAADKFEIVIDASLAENGKDVFVITSQNGKPCIKGNTQLSVATGINWYLNHYAHINLTWNNLTTDLSKVELPLPGSEEKHVCNTTYRYDFNTCTFSYSMAFWTWERWQQEIDWMALHGINAPLNLVGLDVVTRKFLRELGVSENDINAYIAGPGFIAWFAMNNLEGWGGTIESQGTGVFMQGNPDWWYTRQEQLCRNMLQRMRELGMQPVIPGFSGQVPNCIVNYSINGFSSGDVVNNGTWAGGYTRPDILKPNTESYRTFAAVYYKHLHEVMGVSELYSIDPFHEGSLPSGVSNETCYPKIMVELDNYHNGVSQEDKTKNNVDEQPKWIIQYWQGVPQSGAFTAMKNAGYTNRFIGLDLFADNIYADNAAKWRTDYYDTCPYIYCMLHNFGGRSGLHGRLETTMDGYFQALAKGNNCQGIGATPEGTETNPVLYDMLFELPWMDVNNRPTADEWLKDYAYSRYGVENEKALEALQDLKKSVWDCKVNQQGTSEAVILARPNWTVGSVSSWSTSAIYWDTQDVLQAADKLYSIKDVVTVNGGQDGIANYNYDFIDVVRQAMVDYAAQLLPLINAAHNSGDNAEYTRLYQLYLQLMLDLDEMLSYDENFKLERWTSLARNIADEVSGTTENDRNWLEWNARTQVTVWSKGNTDLHDYSNRCWAGLIKDFHYKRWKQFFENNGNAFSGGWYSGFEYPWTVDFNDTYNLAGDYSKVVIPTDMTATEKAAETFGNYFGRIKGATKNYIFPMGVATKATKSDVIPEVYRGQEVELPLVIGKNVTISSVWVDLNNDGAKGNGETLTATNNQVAIPADAKIGKTTAQVVYSDGTDITFNLALVEDITATRTVTAVAGANGSVVIEGTNELSISTTEAVKMIATANTGYNFEKWTDAQGNTVSNDNPYIYYGKEDATFTANFIQDKWGVVACNGSFSGDIAGYAQFIHNLTLAYYNREPETILEETTAPTQIFNTVPTIINVPQGASFDIEYDNGGSDGLKYCYFRAFIDLNQDGDFDDEGELLKEVGTNGAQNAAVCSNKINVLLPYDMPLGITHMRLRFDGAWDNGNKPSERGAKDASIRPVYEIIINVTEKSNKAATINVETNSADWGTVEVWTDETPDGSTGTTWNVSANIPMYLRATKASEDVEFLGWYDHYGRLLTENLEHTMYAREDATYTARFRRILEIDDWQFEYRTTLGTPDMVVLTSVRKSGTHDLVIPETIEILGKQYKIVGFDNNVFNDNKELWTISLPKSIEFLSEKSLLSGTMTGKVASGTGTTDQANYTIYNLEETVVVADGFKVTVKGTSDGSTFNQWGSGLFATGTNPLDAKFDDGFQFYLAKAGNFVLKVDDGDKEYALDNSNCKVIAGTPFTATIVYKNNTITITVDNGAGQTGVYTRGNVTLADISTFSAAIPTGITLNVNVETNKESNPFSGCSNLGEITFNGDCTNYYVNNEGDLYNTGDVLVCSPEGKEKANELRALGVLIDNTEALIEEVTASVNPIGKATEIALSATQGNDYYIWCNNPHIGGNDGAGGVAALLDENPSTYLHSNWSSLSSTHDYLQIDIVNSEDLYELYNFKIAGQQRGDGQNDRPKNIEIYGSNDNSYWTPITTVEDLPNTAGATWESSAISSDVKYSHLKFVVKTHDNYNQTSSVSRPYFHMAKFDLFKLTSTVEVEAEYQEHAGITNDETAEVYDNLVNALYVYNNGGTAQKLQAAYEALEPLYSALNDKKNALYTNQLPELISNTEALIKRIATSIDPAGKATEIALSATEGDNYIWCNAPQAGSSVESLLDNNPSTFFHSNWQSTTAPADGLDHHLTIENLKGIIDLKFRYQGRSGSNLGDYPTTIKVQGSNNGTDYDDIAVVQPRNANGGTIGSGAEWTSERLGNGNKYTYLRFMVTATTSNRNADGHIYWHMAEFDLFKLTSTVEVKSAYKNIAEITNEEAEEAYDLMVSAQYLCNNAGTDEELKTVYEALKSSYDAIKAKIGDNEIEEELPYEIEQTYSGSASWSATSVFPEGLKSGAASGSHGNPATHIGANGDTMYKKVTPVVTNGDDLIVTFTYASGNSHGLIILGVDVVDGNGDVVKADYHVGFTGGEQDNKVYTLTDLDAGNYILRYYVCNKANDHDLNHTGGTISVSGAREIAETEVNAVEAMWTTLKAKAQSDYIAYEGEGLGRYNNTDDIKEKKAATPEATVAGYTAAFVALDDAMDGTPFAKPEAGKFYTIKNNGGTGYLNGDGTSGRVQFNGIENEANSVFYFIDNKLLSYKTGYYLAAKIPSGKNGNFLCYTETVNESTNITFKKSLAKGKLLIEFDGNRSLSSAGIGDSEAADSGQTDANYRFTVEEVTSLPVAVRSAGYATFIAPVALKIPANVKAHTGEVTGNYLVLTEVTGTIPANTGVVLEAAENTYSFNIVADVDSIHSDLVGSTAAKANDKKNEEEIPYYTLQKPGNEVVFMQYNGDVLAGSKAYLDFTANPTSAKSISIRFEGTTDIDSSTLNPQPSTQIYDLMGRRVEAITKGGIYIVNGRKVVVK